MVPRAIWFQAILGLKRHSPWLHRICHLMPHNRNKHHLKVDPRHFYWIARPNSPLLPLLNWYANAPCHHRWYFQVTQFLFKHLSFYFSSILQLWVAFYCSYSRLLHCLLHQLFFLGPQILIFENSLFSNFLIILFVCFLFGCFSFYSFHSVKIFICCHPKRFECFLPLHLWYWPHKVG